MHEIIQEDKAAFLFLNNLGSPPFDQFWIMVSQTFIWIPLYVIFCYLLYKSYGLKNLLYILLFIAIGVTISDQLASVFKNGIERLRPCHDASLDHLLREVKCGGGKFGFYSAHASNTFFVASFLTFLLKKYYRLLPFFVFFWAATVGYSRIYLGVHFPMDVLFGAVVGFLIGGLMSNLALKTIRKRST